MTVPEPSPAAGTVSKSLMSGDANANADVAAAAAAMEEGIEPSELANENGNQTLTSDTVNPPNAGGDTRSASATASLSPFGAKSSRRTSSSFVQRPDADRGPVLRWSNICMDLLEKPAHTSSSSKPSDDHTTNVKKRLLDNVWGEARPGETTAIMGASGAGKTSLFSILSGHRTHNPLIAVSGDIYLGNVKVDDTNQEQVRRTFAFVGQEDVLHQQSTPREAIRFSAKLRLGREFSDDDINTLVEGYVEELGLTKCADSLIGGELMKGISGGERRRTSVGVELVTNPSTIFLDEPTSGLDSVAARTVLQLLDKVAKAGNTVLFTIHQPSSRLFVSFDNLILINSGRLMHMGHTSAIPADFSARGYPIPENTNPADWILEVAEENPLVELQEHGFFPQDTRPPIPDASLQKLPPSTHRKPPLLTQVQLLFKRERLTIQRYPMTFLFTLAVIIFMCILCGILFFGVGARPPSDAGVLSGVLGAIVQVMILNMMMNAGIVNASVVFEKHLFLREYATDHYFVVPFMAAKFTVESLQSLVITLFATVISYFMAKLKLNFGVFFATNFLLVINGNVIATALGATIRNPKLASALLTLAVLPQLFFSGLIVSTTLMPVWISWAQYLCVLRYTSGLVLLYEFEDCGSDEENAYCQGFLTTYGLNQDQRPFFWGMSVALWAAWQLLALVSMQRAGKTF